MNKFIKWFTREKEEMVYGLLFFIGAAGIALNAMEVSRHPVHLEVDHKAMEEEYRRNVELNEIDRRELKAEEEMRRFEARMAESHRRHEEVMLEFERRERDREREREQLLREHEQLRAQIDRMRDEYPEVDEQLAEWRSKCSH